MTSALLTEYKELLSKFESIPKLKRTKTFMEMSGYPHYENVCSNILAFYLNPFNEHGLRDLMLSALMKATDQEYAIDMSYEGIEINREVSAGKKRLDLLITTRNYVVGIENKIFHFLNNNLEEYSKLVKTRCYNSQKPVCIVLSLRKETPYAGFINVTYEQFFHNIKNDIGKYIINADSHYVNLLTDFIKTIQNLNPITMENKDVWKFFKDNAKEIDELRKSFTIYEEYLLNNLTILKNYLNEKHIDLDIVKAEIWKEKNFSCIYYNIPLPNNHIITVDIVIDVYGWQIWLSTPNWQSEDFLFNTLLTNKEFSFLTGKERRKIDERERVIVERFETDEEIEKVSDVVSELLIKIRNYRNTIGINN